MRPQTRFSPKASLHSALDARTGGGGAAHTGLDLTALAKLRDLDPTGKTGLVNRVLVTYQGSLEKLLVQLAQARAAQDWTGIRHGAHTLKSSSASVGAMALSKLCAQVEQHAREGQIEALPPLLDALVVESESVKAAVAHQIQAG